VTGRVEDLADIFEQRLVHPLGTRRVRERLHQALSPLS
jgi:hypothetical protein